jgi:hypothetical protein
MVAAQIQMNAYSGSVGSPTVTQKAAKATAQIDMPIIRRVFLRRLVCLRGSAIRSGWVDDIALQVNDRGTPACRRHTAFAPRCYSPQPAFAPTRVPSALP